MRRANRVVNFTLNGEPETNHPYKVIENFGSFPTPDRVYVKILKYIADHPGSKRLDIIANCGHYNYLNIKTKADAHTCRGTSSHLWSNMLYADMNDYNKKFEYFITDTGRKILNYAYSA